MPNNDWDILGNFSKCLINNLDGTWSVRTSGGGGSTAVSGTFTNASLSSGILTITHNLALSAPFALLITIFDNNAKQIIPDNVTGLTNTVQIDLTSFGTLTGTWGYRYI